MGASLIESLQESKDFRASVGRRYPMKVDFAISGDGNNKWMSKLLRTGRFWGATLSSSE